MVLNFLRLPKRSLEASQIPRTHGERQVSVISERLHTRMLEEAVRG